jgi:catechol 2,3-dioxygenase-like lactoylglutathione lyase family enzyme
MFSHVMIGSNDIDRSKKFYDALLVSLGGREGRVDPKGRVMYLKDGGIFILTRPIDGQPATHGNGTTLGFAAASPEQVHAWHEAGIAAGGTPIEDEPGVRTGAGVSLYLAYLRDPDGNKICAMHRMPA